MPDTAPPARYDLPWKAALTHAFRAFMSFFFPALGAQIDWSIRPRLRDKELAGIGFGSATDSMVADQLVEVRLRDGSAQWVLIHIEVQAQHDASLPRRILDYNYRIFKQYAHAVASLVLLADDDPAWRPQAFHNRVLGTVMGISYATAKLLDFADHTEAMMASRNPFALVTLAHLRTQQAGQDAERRYAAKWQLTKLLYQHGWSKQRIIVLFKAINWMMTLPAPQQEVYWRDVIQLGKEHNMELDMKHPLEWVTPLEQMFIDKGIERGRREGAAALLERQLAQRFGPLPQTVRKKLAKAGLEQVEAWSDALPEALSLKQVFE